MNRLCVAVVLVVGTSLLSGCLPDDTRAAPGRVYVRAQASDPTVGGFLTDDSWEIRFDKLLVALGNVELADVHGETEACKDYAHANYDRLYNFTVAGSQKLGEVYGLGLCEVMFHLRPPSPEALLQNGVIAADRDFMRELTVEGDLTQLPMDGPPPQTAIYVRGTARRGTTTKRFDWKFGAYEALSACTNNGSLPRATTLQVETGDDLQSLISFHGEYLFQRGTGPDPTLEFKRFASADGNADGEITVDELDKQVIGPAVGDEPALTLGTHLRKYLFPQMIYFNGEPCQRVEFVPGWGAEVRPF